MRTFGKCTQLIAILVLSSMVASCSMAAAARTAVTKSSTSPAVTAVQTASPTPSPTIQPTHTPTPTATVTPDPLAAFFTKGGAHLTVTDPDKGPWIYQDTELYIRVDLMKSGSRKYCQAEIYTRGPLPFGGFAHQDDTGRKRALPYLLARQNRAILGITGDFIAHHGNPKGVMIRQGKVYYDKKQAPTMAVLPDGELKVYEPGEITAKQLLAMGVQNSFAFGPILVKDGKIHKSVYTHRLKPGNWRAAIGQVDKGHYISIVSISGFTLAETAKLFLDNHCTVAYNLDGGHSASIVFMGEQLYRGGRGKDNQPQRPLCDMLLIGTSTAVPDATDPVYCDGVSINSKYRPKPTDGPIG